MIRKYCLEGMYVERCKNIVFYNYLFKDGCDVSLRGFIILYGVKIISNYLMKYFILKGFFILLFFCSIMC